MATGTKKEVWREHFLCKVPLKILHNYKAYADSIQMHPFTNCKQSTQLGQQPLSCEAICYTTAIHSSVYRISFVLCKDILKNITSHYSFTELETGSITLISPSVPW